MITNLLIKLNKMTLVRKSRYLLDIPYYSLRKLRAQKDLKKNQSLKNRHEGRRCFIFGTGASANEIDLSKFGDEYTFACNSFFLHKDFANLNLSFFSMVDGMYGLWNNHVQWYRPPIFFPKLERSCRSNSTVFFFNFSTKQFIKKNGLFVGRPVHYVIPRRNKKEERLTLLDLHKQNDFLIGSLPFMVAASIYMGFKELYLFGMGFTYEPTQHGHFYDPPEVLEEAKTWENQPIDERHYDIKSTAERNGVKIFNVVPEGFESPVYKSVSLKDIYQLLIM